MMGFLVFVFLPLIVCFLLSCLWEIGGAVVNVGLYAVYWIRLKRIRLEEARYLYRIVRFLDCFLLLIYDLAKQMWTKINLRVFLGGGGARFGTN